MFRKVLLFAICASAVIGSSRIGWAQNARESASARDAARLAYLMKSLRGDDTTWYVVSTRQKSTNGSVTTTTRGRTVVQGKQAAAMLVVNYLRSGDNRWGVEPFNTEAQAQERAAYWRNLDKQAGYR